MASIFSHPKDMHIDPHPNAAHYQISLESLDAAVVHGPERQILYVKMATVFSQGPKLSHMSQRRCLKERMKYYR